MAESHALATAGRVSIPCCNDSSGHVECDLIMHDCGQRGDWLLLGLVQCVVVSSVSLIHPGRQSLLAQSRPVIAAERGFVATMVTQQGYELYVALECSQASSARIHLYVEIAFAENPASGILNCRPIHNLISFLGPHCFIPH